MVTKQVFMTERSVRDIAAGPALLAHCNGNMVLIVILKNVVIVIMKLNSTLITVRQLYYA